MQIFLTVLLTILAINSIVAYKVYKILKLGNRKINYHGVVAIIFHLFCGIVIMYYSYFRNLVRELLEELSKHDTSN